MASQGEISDYLQARVSVFSVELETHVTVALIVVGGANDASRALEEELRAVFEDGVSARSDTEVDRRVEVQSHDEVKDWKSVVQLVHSSGAIVLLFNKKPPLTVRPLALLTMKRRVSTPKGVLVYLVDNFPSRTESGETNPLDLLQHPRIRDLFQRVVKLTGKDDAGLRRLAADVRAGLTSDDADRRCYEGIGEAFAWNFVFTFLRLVVPKFDERIMATFQDGENLSQDKLKRNGFDLHPAEIIVVKRYFVLVPETLDQKIDKNLLFDGCENKCLLRFEGLGYQRKVFVYLMKLSSNTAARRTYAIVFGDWVCPVFNIRKMDLRAEQGREISEIKGQIFQQFKVALKLILNHASFPKLLFSSRLDERGASPEWSSKLEMLEVSSAESLRKRLEMAVANYSDPTTALVPLARLSINQGIEPHLLVKMGNSMDERETLAVREVLESKFNGRYKLLQPSESVLDDINSCERILLVAGAQELRDADDAEYIDLAAKKMNITGKCCVSVIIVGDTRDELKTIHEVLPDRLKHLPYCCVATVKTLSGRNVEGRLQYGLPQSTLDGVFSGLRLDENCLCIEDVFPIMSMASVLTVNICCGSVDKIEDYVRRKLSKGREPPFDLPYFLVLPKNNRFPEETTLEHRLCEAGAECSKKEFKSDGKPYNYNVWHWKSKRLAFEIPGQFSYLREQLDWGFAGLVTEEHVDDLLKEFGKDLREHCRSKENVATVEWDCRSDFSAESEAEVLFQKSQAEGLLLLLKDEQSYLSNLKP